MKGRWALLPPCQVYFNSFGRNMRTSGLLEVIFSGLWQCCTKEQTAVLLVIFCPPTAHITSTGSTGLSPGISSTVLTLCWETKQTFWQQHVRMCHPGGAAQHGQLSWAAGNALCYHWW